MIAPEGIQLGRGGGTFMGCAGMGENKNAPNQIRREAWGILPVDREDATG